MSLLATLSAIGSIGSAFGGGLASAAANDAAKQELRAQNARERAEQNRLLMRGYVNSSENQNLLRKLQEMQRLSYNRARATNVVAGGTDAHLASMQEAGNKIVTDTAGNIAARADAWKDRTMQQGLLRDRAYSQQMFGLEQQRAQNIAAAAGQATKAFAGIAAAAGSADNPFGTYEDVLSPEAESALDQSRALTDLTTEQDLLKMQDELDNNVPVFGKLDTTVRLPKKKYI